MRVSIITPGEVFTEENTVKVIAEGHRGYFCLLPRHVDFTEALVPGILSCTLEDGQEIYTAVDEGILVKKMGDVNISVKAAIRGKELGSLKRIVGERIEALDEREKKSRQILAKLEADFARRFLELK